MKRIAVLLKITIAFGLIFNLSSCKKEGCTNPQATNYDSDAKKDDGSCKLPTKKSKDKPSTKAPANQSNAAAGKISTQLGKGTSNASRTTDNKAAKGNNDITYQLGAYGWVTDPDDPSDEIVVLVIADADEVIYYDVVFSDEDGYYEFDWTLTQDKDADAPYREMVIFTYNDEKDELCDITDDFNYGDFNDIVSGTEGYYEAEDIEACDW